MSTSPIGTVLDGLADGFVAALATAGIDAKVFSGKIPQAEAGLKCIAFGDGRCTEIAATSGGGREETWTISGELRVVRTWVDGSTEATIAAARTDALALLAIVETYLNDTFTGDLPDVELASIEMANDYGPEGRICRIGLDFTVTATKNP